MNLLFERLRRMLAVSPPVARWVLGVLIAAAIAAFLWLGRDTDRGPAPPSVAGASPIEDVLSPADADHDPTPQDATGQSGDIIPPEEP